MSPMRCPLRIAIYLLEKTTEHIQKAMKLLSLCCLLAILNGCTPHAINEPRSIDQFGRSDNLSRPSLPFRADRYVVKADGLEYRPNVIVVHGDWFQLRWFEEGKYLPKDVWVPRHAISAIEKSPPPKNRFRS